MRDIGRILAQSASSEELLGLQQLIARLQNSADALLPACARRNDGTDEVRQLLLCDALRSSYDMRSVLTTCAKIMLPRSHQDEVLKALEEKRRVMCPATLSRSRFLLDGSLMLWWRLDNQKALDRGAAFWIMTDSSPQFHRNYQVTLLRRVERSSMAGMWRAARALFFMWHTDSPDTDFDDDALFYDEVRHYRLPLKLYQLFC